MALAHADCTSCTHTAKPAPIPCSSVGGRDSVPTLRECIESPLSSCLCHGWCICLLKQDLRPLFISGHLRKPLAL